MKSPNPYIAIRSENGFPFKFPDSSTMVIFGASGDLTHRKLIPALYNLYRKVRLPESFCVVGFSRSVYTHDQFRQNLLLAAQDLAGEEIDQEDWQEFSKHIYYFPGDINKASDFKGLSGFLNNLETGINQPHNRIYYLAISPEYYEDVITQLGAITKKKKISGWNRIVIEKPFGQNLETATRLNLALHTVFDEKQIYRIDHYLGKETAQNILFLRFANTIFEPIWNRTYIDHVQITVAENLTIGHRGGYYDKAGVLRDIFQNHLIQLLALMTMEPPSSFNADAVRNETYKVLSAVRPIKPEAVWEHTVRGQYRGYRQEKGIPPDSNTATFGVVRLFIDNWRWQGVPFYLRSGKGLSEKCSQIILEFNEPPHVMFPMPPDKQIPPNRLALSIQPDEGIQLRFEAKVPDTVAEMRSVDMTFEYDASFGKSILPDAYERLLMDVFHGDASLFTRNDAIELAWKFIDPIQRGWESEFAPHLELYETGSWGPTEAAKFIARDGRQWLNGQETAE